MARASRILVEGVHDAELVEKVWGDDLRVEGVVVERLDGMDHLAAVVAFRPGPAGASGCCWTTSSTGRRSPGGRGRAPPPRARHRHALRRRVAGRAAQGRRHRRLARRPDGRAVEGGRDRPPRRPGHARRVLAHAPRQGHDVRRPRPRARRRGRAAHRLRHRRPRPEPGSQTSKPPPPPSFVRSCHDDHHDRRPSRPATPAPCGRPRPLLFGFFPTQVLHVAATLQIADHLDGGPRTTADLAAATDRRTRRSPVLRALACFGVLDEVEPGTWALGPHGPGLLTEGPPRCATWCCCSPATRCGGRGASSARRSAPASPRGTGSPACRRSSTCAQPRVPGDVQPGHGRGHPQRGPGSPRPAGSTGSARSSTSVAATARCSPRARRPPGLRGTVFDLAEGMDTAPQVLAGAGVTDRATPRPATSSPPSRAADDAYLVKSVIHDWDDDRAARPSCATSAAPWPTAARCWWSSPSCPTRRPRRPTC